MQLFNGTSLRRKHYMNPNNPYMHQDDTHMRHKESLIPQRNMYMHQIEAYTLQLDQK
jgi:hypothetical protein